MPADLASGIWKEAADHDRLTFLPESPKKAFYSCLRIVNIK